MAPESKGRRKKLVSAFRKSAGILDMPTYAALLLGELLQTHRDAGHRSFKVALWIAQAALPLAKSKDRMVAPIAHLALGYAYYLLDRYTHATLHLQRARDLFKEFPDSPYKQYYLGRCLVHLCVTLDESGNLVEAGQVAAECRKLMTNLVSMTDEKVDKKGRTIFVPKDGEWRRTPEGIIFSLTHMSGSWWTGCFYVVLELTRKYLHNWYEHTGSGVETEPLQTAIVSLLAKTPVDTGNLYYQMERSLASCMSIHGKPEECLKIWLRLLRWSFSEIEGEDEEQDEVQCRLIECLAARLYRNNEALAELEKTDVTYALVHYDHGCALAHNARRLYYRTGQYEALLRMCTIHDDIYAETWAKYNPTVLYNYSYIGRMLKKLDRFDESMETFRKALDLAEIASRPPSEDARPPSWYEESPWIQPFRAHIHRSIAHLSRLCGRLHESAFHYRQSTKFHTRDGPLTCKQIRGTLKSLGYLYEVLGDEKNASIAYDKLHREYARKSKRDEFATMKLYYYRGRMFLLLREFDFAVQLFEKAAVVMAGHLEKLKDVAGELEQSDGRILGSQPDDEISTGSGSEPVNGIAADSVSPAESGVEEVEASQSQPSRERKRGATGGVQEVRSEQRNGSSPADVPAREPETEAGGTSRTAPRNRPPERAPPTTNEPQKTSEHTHNATSHPLDALSPLDEETKKKAKEECHRLDREFDDYYPFGPEDGIRIFAKNDGWWPRTIEESIEAARKKEQRHPVPLDRYDSDSDEELEEGDEPISATQIATSPIGRRTNELVVPKFDELPDDYEKFSEERRMRERYPWRFEHLGLNRNDE